MGLLHWKLQIRYNAMGIFCVRAVRVRLVHSSKGVTWPPACVPILHVNNCVSWLQVLGTPTREDIHAMNPNYTEFKFPHIKAHPWSKVFSKRLPADAVDLVGS